MLNRGLLAAVYGFTIIFGFLTITRPAPAIEGVIGLPFTYVYGVMLLFGALGAMVGIIIPNYRIEAAFLWGVAGGYTMFAISLWALYFDRLLNPTDLPASYGSPITATVLSLFLFAKIILLRKKNKQLIKQADIDRLG